MECFSRQLKALEGKFHFRFRPKCENLRINHLIFADDLMLFSRGDLTSVKYMMACLEKFAKYLGLEANSLKSNMYHAGIKEQELERIMDITGIGLGEFPFRYFGIPLLVARLNVIHYEPLVNRISNKFIECPGKTLSYASRLERVSVGRKKEATSRLAGGLCSKSRRRIGNSRLEHMEYGVEDKDSLEYTFEEGHTLVTMGTPDLFKQLLHLGIRSEEGGFKSD
ncbi:uncharacterized protein LOC131160841 [Malania oleifera]|uniref:uncharacterized protein LOC131160841 n=1 Tax=Malania oleifera TaxID=397392 RepID=UPI0025AE1787|nr:uncharacterized protein LOC131160841 [Malania oleifera]